MSPETLHIVVDVQVDGDQILGQADDGVTEPKAFSGWLGLIGALDGLVRSAAEEGPPDPGHQPRPDAAGRSGRRSPRRLPHLPNTPPKELP